MSTMQWQTWLHHFLIQVGWVGTATVIILTALAILVEWCLYRLFFSRLKKTSHIRDDVLLDAIHRPLQWFLIIFGLLTAISFMPVKTILAQYTSELILLRMVVFEIFLGWVFVRFIQKLETRYVTLCQGQHKYVDKSLVHTACQLSKITIIVIIGLVLLQTVNIPIAGLLAFGGVGGLAFGFAAKDALSNLISGFIILLDRPFTEGDYVRSPDKKFDGRVEKIGWRSTIVRNINGYPMYIPNGVFSTILVENLSRMNRRQVHTTVKITCEDAQQLPELMAAIKQTVLAATGIDTEQKTTVRLADYTDNTSTLIINTYLKGQTWENYQTMQQVIFQDVLKVVKQYGFTVKSYSGLMED